ncbi:MAG: tetratricopeptide repeat protein [Myxococcota bacterium]
MLTGIQRPTRVGTSILLLAVGAACTSPDVPEPRHEVSVSARIEAAERAMRRADYDTAIGAYRDAFQRTPWNTRLGRTLAAAYVKRATQSRHSGGVPGLREAEKDLRAALELVPEDGTLRRSLAVVLVEQAARQGDPARAGALREEARSYAPELVDTMPVRQVRVERKLDLAYELIERGQLDAGIDALERLHRAHPSHAATTGLLARAYVQRADGLAVLGDLTRAGEALDRAVALYDELEGCPGEACAREELRLAHHNRIHLWLNAERLSEARAALREAEAVGLSFSELREALSQE